MAVVGAVAGRTVNGTSPYTPLGPVARIFTVPGASALIYPRLFTAAIDPSELDHVSVGVTIANVVSRLVANAGLVKPTGACAGSSTVSDTEARSPSFTTKRGALPDAPLNAVAVIVAIPVDTPVATPVTGSTVAIDVGSV